MAVRRRDVACDVTRLDSPFLPRLHTPASMALTPTLLSETTLLQLLVHRVPALLVDEFLQPTSFRLPDAYPAQLVSSVRAALEQGERDTLVARLRCVDKGLRDACSRFTDKSPLDSLRRHVKCSTLKVLISELDLRPVPMNSKRLQRLQQLFDCITVDKDPLFPLLSEPHPWLSPKRIYSFEDPVARRWRELQLQAMRDPVGEETDLQASMAMGLSREGPLLTNIMRDIVRHEVLEEVVFGGMEDDEE